MSEDKAVYKIKRKEVHPHYGNCEKCNKDRKVDDRKVNDRIYFQ